MNKIDLDELFYIGTTRSGKIIEISPVISDKTINEFLKPFDIEDLVDVYCLTDFQLLKNYRLNADTRKEAVLAQLFSSLSVHTSLIKAQNKLEINSSIDRIRWAMSLM